MLMPSIFGESFMNDFFDFPYSNANGMMQTDVSETDKGYKVTMNLPGYKKEDVRGEVKDGYLTITASTTKNNDEKNKDGKYIRKERFSGTCSRSFYVGDACFLQALFGQNCKIFLDIVAKRFWTLLHVQIGQSCNAPAGCVINQP